MSVNQCSVNTELFTFLCSRCLLEAYWSTWWVSARSVTLTLMAVKAAHRMSMDTRTTDTHTASTATEGMATLTEGMGTGDMVTPTAQGVEA